MGVKEILDRMAAARGGTPRPVKTTPKRAAPLPVLPPCEHEGPVIESCQSCGNKEGRHVRACLHPTADRDTCTRAFVSEKVQACATCPDHSARARPAPNRSFSPIETRHLLYHLYPRRGSRWRERVLRVHERIELFNGRRVVAVALDGTTEGPDQVSHALHGTGAEPFFFANDPSLREVASFRPLFDRVADLREPGHAVLYAHSKGVTRPPNATCHLWASVLEDVMLGCWSAVDKVLTDRPVAGCFKKIGNGWASTESKSRWHYSGSFYWFRPDHLFTRSGWETIDRFWAGIEPYPSLHFSEPEAGCVFYQGTTALNLYSRAVWDSKILPEYATWLAVNRGLAASSAAVPT